MEQARKRRSLGVDWSVGKEDTGCVVDPFFQRKKWDRVVLWSLILGGIGLMAPVLVIFRNFFGNMDSRVERSLLVSMLMIFTFLWKPLGRKDWQKPLNAWFIVDAIAITIVAIGQVYLIYMLYGHDTSGWLLGGVRIDYILGSVIILLGLEATRRAFGWAMVIIPILFITYAFTANFFPGALKGAAVSWGYLITILWIEPQGIFGLGADVLISMLFLYLLFGSILVGCGGAAVFTSLASSLVGTAAGGPAKVAVIGSGLFGMVSGSAVANVAAVGCVTIPMMKRIGYAPHFAGAVEAVASSGGQMMPPVMGTTAFLISAFTGIPYFEICIMAAMPALLYYLGLFFQIHFEAKRLGLGGMKEDDLPSFFRVMKEGAVILLPLIILVLLLASGYSVGFAGAAGILGVIMFSFFRKDTRQTPRQLVTMIVRSTEQNMSTAMAVIAVGILTGAMMSTMLGTKLSLLVQQLYGGSILLALILAALIAIVLGMGLSTPVIYLLAYAFIIPTLIRLGVPTIVAHLFVFGFAISAQITPPVAMASYVAAAIAKVSFWPVGWHGMRLGIAAFIVPFIFAFQPALLILGGDYGIGNIIVTVFSSVVGLLFAASGLEGFLRRQISMPWRILLFAAGLLLAVSPGLQLKGIGLVVGAIGIILQLLPARKSATGGQNA